MQARARRFSPKHSLRSIDVEDCRAWKAKRSVRGLQPAPFRARRLDGCHERRGKKQFRPIRCSSRKCATGLFSSDFRARKEKRKKSSPLKVSFVFCFDSTPMNEIKAGRRESDASRKKLSDPSDLIHNRTFTHHRRRRPK